MTPEKREIVRVARESRAAFDAPQILIEYQGKYYLSTAMLEYDPNHPEISKEQAEDIETLGRILRQGLADGRGLQAVDLQAELAKQGPDLPSPPPPPPPAPSTMSFRTFANTEPDED